ncbi:MAG TPA: AprI/Inh family metalloprotease inhibitor [Afipia sp.]
MPGGPGAQAQDGRSLSNDMIGQWELSTAGRDKTCVITLKSDATPQGMKLELEKGCGDALPFTKAIATWSVKGLDIVRLQDAKGQSVIDVTEVESGIFEGTRSGEGVYLLQNLAAARALSKSTDQLIGDWTMLRGNGNAVCSLTLTNTPVEKSPENLQDNFQVFLKPRCEPAITAFAPVMWRMDRGEIQLVSAKGEIWRFEADDNAQWRLVPDTADPLIMTRQ